MKTFPVKANEDGDWRARRMLTMPNVLPGARISWITLYLHIRRKLMLSIPQLAFKSKIDIPSTAKNLRQLQRLGFVQLTRAGEPKKLTWPMHQCSVPEWRDYGLVTGDFSTIDQARN